MVFLIFRKFSSFILRRINTGGVEFFNMSQYRLQMYFLLIHTVNRIIFQNRFRMDISQFRLAYGYVAITAVLPCGLIYSTLFKIYVWKGKSFPIFSWGLCVQQNSVFAFVSSFLTISHSRHEWKGNPFERKSIKTFVPERNLLKDGSEKRSVSP